MSMTEILNKYTAGQTTLEETNAALAEMGAGIHLEPGKNELTAEETAAAKAETAATANGFGLLDTGTGTLDKARVKDGRLVNCDMGESYALLIIAGRTYRVKGTALVEPEPEKEAPASPARPDMHRRKDLAGQVVRQTTKSGLYDVTYGADGYAVKARMVS